MRGGKSKEQGAKKKAKRSNSENGEVKVERGSEKKATRSVASSCPYSLVGSVITIQNKNDGNENVNLVAEQASTPKMVRGVKRRSKKKPSGEKKGFVSGALSSIFDLDFSSGF